MMGWYMMGWYMMGWYMMGWYMMGWYMMGWYMMGWYMMGYIITFNRLAGISNVSLLVPPMVLPRSQEFTDTHCKLVIQSYTQSI